jgi:predicted PurR-regulated permease PerM
MAHTPVNHPLRPFYRVLSGLVGLYVVLFGILGLILAVPTAAAIKIILAYLYEEQEGAAGSPEG